MATPVENRSSLKTTWVALSNAGSSLGEGFVRGEDEKFTSTMVGLQYLKDFDRQLNDAFEEAKEYGDPLPSDQQMDLAKQYAITFWRRIPEPKVMPSINLSGQIVLTIVYSATQRSIVVI